MQLRLEFGVRTMGGHVKARPSVHVAVREAEKLIADGEKNVWVVVREVSDWRAADEAYQVTA